jgi:RNA polymerase primary sigma factor
MGLAVKKIQEIQSYVHEPISIHATLGDDNGTELGELLIDESSPDKVDVVSARYMKAALEKVLNTLSEREREVILLRKGFYDGQVRTLEQTGNILNITRERVRQLEQNATSKLKHPARRAYIEDFFDD